MHPKLINGMTIEVVMERAGGFSYPARNPAGMDNDLQPNFFCSGSLRRSNNEITTAGYADYTD
jgi:hypothetical protein